MVQPIIIGPNKHRLWLQILMCGQGGAAFSAYAWGTFPVLPHGHADPAGTGNAPARQKQRQVFMANLTGYRLRPERSSVLD